MDEDDFLGHWAAAEEAQAITALMNMYLAEPDPQASVDSNPYDMNFEVRLWGQRTKALRAK